MCSVHPIIATEMAGHDEVDVYIFAPSQETSGICTASETHRPVAGGGPAAAQWPGRGPANTFPRRFLTMVRKPPERRQLSLFPPNPADSLEPQDKLSYKQEGDHNAVQDDHPRTPATTTGDARPAPQEPEAAPDTGTLRARAEDQPRNLDRNSLPGETGQRP